MGVTADLEDFASSDGNSAFCVTFYPKLWKQRTCLASLIMEGAQASEVIDLGCGEGQILSSYAENSKIQRLYGVDQSCQELVTASQRLAPDYYKPPRETPLSIHLLKGNILTPSLEFHNRNDLCASFQEVIEHMEEHLSKEAASSIFSKIAPRLAIVTTPNVEFNALFPNGGKDLRNEDHKFEWTRQQFRDWTDFVCNSVSDEYAVFHVGLGEPPPELPPYAFGHKAAHEGAATRPKTAGVYLRWFDDWESPKFVLPGPPEDTDCCIDPDTEEMSKIPVEFSGRKHRVLQRIREGPEIGRIFGIPIIPYHAEWNLYLNYGPCTSVAIFFKRDSYPEQVDNLICSMGMLSYVTAPSPLLAAENGQNNAESCSDGEASGWSPFQTVKWPSLKDPDFDINESLRHQIDPIRRLLLAKSQQPDEADSTYWIDDQVLWTTLDAVWLNFNSSNYIRRVCGDDRALFQSLLEENQHHMDFRFKHVDETAHIGFPLPEEDNYSESTDPYDSDDDPYGGFESNFECLPASDQPDNENNFNDNNS